MKRAISFLSILLLSTGVVSASDRVLDFRNLRSLSMGGISVGMAFDDQALVNNPAGLALAEQKFKAFRLRGAINADELSSYSAVYDAITDSSASEQDRLRRIIQYVPFDFSSNFAATPLASYVNKGFGVGVFSSLVVDGGIYNKINTRVDAQITGDLAGVVGLAREVSIADRKLYVGANLKYVNRSVYYDNLTGVERINIGVDELLNIVDSGDTLPDNYALSSAGGIGIDAGILMPVEFGIGKGHVGASVQNLLSELSGTRKINNVDTSFTRQIPTTVTVGLGLEQEKVFFFDKVTYGIDYRIVSPETSLVKDLFMGVEGTLFGNFLRLRGGLYQGYVVGGIGIDTAWVSVDLAHYTIERGSQLEDDPVSYYAMELRLFF